MSLRGRAGCGRPARPGLAVVSVGAADQLTEFFAAGVWQAGPVSVAVTADFFRWRVMDHRLNPQRVVAAMDGSDVVAVCAYSVDQRRRLMVTALLGTGRRPLRAAAAKLLRAAARESGARWIFTWEPKPDGTLEHLRRLPFIVNPSHRGMFSHRTALITRSDSDTVQGVRWSDGENFDLQPFMHD